MRIIDLRVVLATSVLAFLAAGSLASPGQALAQERDAYLSIAERSFEEGLTSIPAQVEAWKENFDPVPEWGYAPPGGPPYFARLAGSLYKLTGDERYAREAIRWLAVHHEYKEYFPEEMQSALSERMVEESWSVREAEQWAAKVARRKGRKAAGRRSRG